MSEEETTQVENPREERGSPIPGCLILSAIVIVFGGLVVLYTFVGIYQNRTIGEFTQDTAAVVSIEAPTGTETAAVTAKLLAIEAAVKANRAERFFFTARDLNIMIATLDVAKDFRGNTMVEKIGSEGLVAPMAQPLRKGIFDKGKRYLNATFLPEPELRARTIAFKVRDIRPAVGTVPQGFIDNYSVIDFFRLDPENPAIKANVKSLGGIYIENDQLVVETQIREDNAE